MLSVSRLDVSVSIYLLLKFLHVLLAIIAVGFNASYPIWLGRARHEPEHSLHVLRGIKTLDDRFANPAYALLLVLGLAMTFIAGIPLTTFWIGASLVLYVCCWSAAWSSTHPRSSVRSPRSSRAAPRRPSSSRSAGAAPSLASCSPSTWS